MEYTNSSDFSTGAKFFIFIIACIIINIIIGVVNGGGWYTWYIFSMWFIALLLTTFLNFRNNLSITSFTISQLLNSYSVQIISYIIWAIAILWAIESGKVDDKPSNASFYFAVLSSISIPLFSFLLYFFNAPLKILMGLFLFFFYISACVYAAISDMIPAKYSIYVTFFFITIFGLLKLPNYFSSTFQKIKTNINTNISLTVFPNDLTSPMGIAMLSLYTFWYISIGIVAFRNTQDDNTAKFFEAMVAIIPLLFIIFKGLKLNISNYSLPTIAVNILATLSLILLFYVTIINVMRGQTSITAINGAIMAFGIFSLILYIWYLYKTWYTPPPIQ